MCFDPPWHLGESSSRLRVKVPCEIPQVTDKCNFFKSFLQAPGALLASQATLCECDKYGEVHGIGLDTPRRSCRDTAKPINVICHAIPKLHNASEAASMNHFLQFCRLDIFVMADLLAGAPTEASLDESQTFRERRQQNQESATQRPVHLVRHPLCALHSDKPGQ